MKIKPDSMIPIANKTDRRALDFYIDAVMNMCVAGILSEDEAGVLFDKVFAWASRMEREQK